MHLYMYIYLYLKVTLFKIPYFIYVPWDVYLSVYCFHEILSLTNITVYAAIFDSEKGKEMGDVHILVSGDALHISRNPSVCGWRHNVMAYYFLLSCFFEWIWEPATEQHLRAQSLKLRRCHTNGDSALLQYNLNCWDKEIKEKRGTLSEKGGKNNFQKSLNICLTAHESKKNSLKCGYMSTGAACDSTFQCCLCNGAAKPNADDRRAGRTAPNLHFIFIFLFSTNKATPEKT